MPGKNLDYDLCEKIAAKYDFLEPDYYYPMLHSMLYRNDDEHGDGPSINIFTDEDDILHLSYVKNSDTLPVGIARGTVEEIEAHVNRLILEGKMN